MPLVFGSSDPNQLEGKDDIEEDSIDLVNLVRTRPHHSNDPNDAVCISEQSQLLPANYNQQTFAQSKNATRIYSPMGGTKRKPLDRGPQPQSTLHRAKNHGNALLRKRELPGSATQNSNEDSRPKKQQKTKLMIEQPSMDSDDDLPVVPYDREGKMLLHQHQERRKQNTAIREDTSQSRNIPLKSPQDNHDLLESPPTNMEPRQSKLGENQMIKLDDVSARHKGMGRADIAFVQEVEGIEVARLNAPMVSTHTGATQNDASRWSSGDSLLNKWGNGGDKKKRASMVQNQRQKSDISNTKLNLLCFQNGIKSYQVEEGTQSLFIQVEPHENLAAFYGGKGRERQIWSIDLRDVSSIISVHVNVDDRKFEIKLGPKSPEPSTHVVFTLKQGEDIDRCKTEFFKENVGNTPTEKDRAYFDSLINGLRMREARDETSNPRGTSKIMVSRQQNNRQKAGIAVEIPVAVRRSTRNKPDRMEKAGNISLKRSRGSSTDDFREPSVSSKLELPKPRWKKSLVYPPIGPKREIVDYDDLSRLNSNQFLNDNIVNFYLRYIEVQLQKQNPELAKETYFLNTFFYERLTKRDEKGKREIDSVLKWTAKVDIFKTSYIVVPINESSHWYLAIICNLCHLERKMKDKVPNSPESNSIDLESSGTLAETNEDDQDMPSRNVSDAGIATDAKSTFVLRESEGKQQDFEIIGTQDSLERMDLDEWPKPIENVRSNGDEKPAESSSREVIELDDSSSQKLKPKGKSKPRVKEKPLQRKKSHIAPDTPAIIILDSMRFESSPHAPTIRNLRDYLVAEAQQKRNLAITKDDITAVYAKAPNQNNWYDCGLFLLHYVERFLNKPKEFVAMFLAKENRRQDQELWRKEEINHMRDKLFHLFIKLHGEQETDEMQEGSRKREKVNGNEDNSRKVRGGKWPVEDAMKIDAEAPTKDKDAQKLQIAPGPTVESGGKGFEKFTAEFDELITSGGCDRHGKEDASTNSTTQVTDDPVTQPIDLEEASSSMLQHREVTLPVRDSQ